MIITKKTLRDRYKLEIKHYLKDTKKDPWFHILSIGNKLIDFYVVGFNYDYIFKIHFPNEKLDINKYKDFLLKEFPDDIFISHKFFIIYPSKTNQSAQFLEISKSSTRSS